MAIAALSLYIMAIFLVDSSNDYARYFIETKCELVINYNGNNVLDNYYICDDWSK